MDIKKSREADLEQGHTTWFLLGLVLVLAVAYVALEFNSGDAETEGDARNLLTDMPRDDGYVPMIPPERLMRVVRPEPKPAPEPARLRVVEEKTAETSMAEEEDTAAENAADSTASGIGDIASEAEPKPDITPAQNPMRLRVVENLPQFPGGPAELMRWLTKNLHYPRGAQRQKIEGTVVARFIVEADGSVTGITIVQKLHPLCDREALRVLRAMPRWTPGVQNDEPCRAMVQIPIVFKL